MNKKKVLFMILLVLVELTIIGIKIDDQSEDTAMNVLETQQEGTMIKENKKLSCIYYNEIEFVKTINSKQPYVGLQNTMVGIIPHHLVAGDMIAGFLEGVATKEVETIVVIGPSHDNKEQGITTSSRSWDTAFGTLEMDGISTQSLLKLQNVEVNNNWEHLQKDQAISSIIPYLRKYFSNIEVVSILVGKDVKENEIDRIVEYLEMIAWNKKIIVLGSIDFSHYLSSDQAEKKDVETLQLIKEKDYKKIKELSSDYLDSPQTLLILMKYIEAMKYKDLEFIDRSSSLEKIGIPETSKVFKDGITSYLILKSDK